MTAPLHPFHRPQSFAWFWSFWSWGAESHRVGESLRDPLRGIGALWDEWYHHEATPAEQRAIETISTDVRRQHEFVRWLVRRWGRDARYVGDVPNPRLVLGDLARLPPFVRWSALERFRTGYGTRGVAAVVLSQGSVGAPGDVRSVEAIAHASIRVVGTRDVVAEGFHVERAELRAVREAVRGALGGNGLLRLLVLWLLLGRRPYHRHVSTLLSIGWGAMAAAMLYLLAARDSDRWFEPLAATLLVLWLPLGAAGLAVSAAVCWAAWRDGRWLAERSHRVELRLRMVDGLSLVGGSAGLAFALNLTSALLREARGRSAPSWLWRRVRRGLRTRADRWAATGVVASNGSISSVVLEPKLRACRQHAAVECLLTPRQPGAGRHARQTPAASAELSGATLRGAAPVSALGFASAPGPFRIQGCGHVAEAMLAVADLRSTRQLVSGLTAGLVSLAMLVALPDLWRAVDPPRAPVVVATEGSSPFHLAVRLDTRDAASFVVALESRFWANRRQGFERVRGHAQTNVPLRKLVQRTNWDLDDGTLWIERRRHFLLREYAPGERIGRYSISYLNRLNR